MDVFMIFCFFTIHGSALYKLYQLYVHCVSFHYSCKERQLILTGIKTLRLNSTRIESLD